MIKNQNTLPVIQSVIQNIVIHLIFKQYKLILKQYWGDSVSSISSWPSNTFNSLKNAC
jgi:hypothetical protein